MRFYFQNDQSKKAWRCGTSHRAPALQAQSPEFKPSAPEKQKEIQPNDVAPLNTASDERVVE
jgi:hypothetical protein